MSSFNGFMAFGTSHAPASLFLTRGAAIAMVTMLSNSAILTGNERGHCYGDRSPHDYGRPGGTWEMVPVHSAHAHTCKEKL